MIDIEGSYHASPQTAREEIKQMGVSGLFNVFCKLCGLVVIGIVADELIKFFFWPIIFTFVAVSIAAFIYAWVKDDGI